MRYHCEKMGHYKSECWSLQNADASTNFASCATKESEEMQEDEICMVLSCGIFERG